MVMGDVVREVDVVVVGGGPGGYSAAFRCADLGLETVIVDGDGRLGGACLHEGCIPSKALLHVAHVVAEAERAREFGVEFGPPRFALDPLRKWKAERVVGKLAKGLAGVARAKKGELVAGRGTFEGSRTLRVAGEAPQTIRFGHAIVATGSEPAPLRGVATGERIMDSTAALEVPDVPERLLVVGGGYIGLELGQVYAALGSRVTLVEMADGVLPGLDRDLVQPLAREVGKRFAEIRLGTRVDGLREVGAEGEATLGGRAERFDRAPVAVGRRPRSVGLGLETTRARVDGRGLLAVDGHCRTDDPPNFALRDVTGATQPAHPAMSPGKAAAAGIARR